MPELPEVQTVVNSLAPRVTGRVIRHALLLRGDIVSPIGFELTSAIVGRRVEQVRRRAKRIVFSLSDGNRFFVHLGMTGRLVAARADAPLARHTHFVMRFDQFEIRFSDPRRFGGIHWLGDAHGHDDAIGPEPLEMRAEELARNLARTRRVVKTALLDQRVVAGLGNIYVDEALFAARIHPLTPANALVPARVAKLSRAIKLTLRRALRHRGSTLRDYVDADGIGGGFQKLHRVYARAGQPCHSCRREIVRIVVGGRSTCFCPKCQPAPRRVAGSSK